MIFKIRTLLTSFMLILIILGCEEDSSDLLLMDKVWKLRVIRLRFDASISIDRPEKYNIEFKEVGIAAVQADCNTCGAIYDTVGDSISILIGDCTRRGCGEKSFGAEYVNALKESVFYEIHGNKLSLISDVGNLVFD